MAASQNRPICEHDVDETPAWRRRMLKSIDQSYRKSPFHAEMFPMLSELISLHCRGLAEYLRYQISAVRDYLGIDTEIIESSTRYGNSGLSGQQRILDICLQEGASTYVNAPGGRNLYDPDAFAGAGVTLKFLEMADISYAQPCDSFVPHLSIIDMLMQIGCEGARDLLPRFTLIGAAADAD